MTKSGSGGGVRGQGAIRDPDSGAVLSPAAPDSGHVLAARVLGHSRVRDAEFKLLNYQLGNGFGQDARGFAVVGSSQTPCWSCRLALSQAQGLVPGVGLSFAAEVGAAPFGAGIASGGVGAGVGTAAPDPNTIPLVEFQFRF